MKNLLLIIACIFTCATLSFAQPVKFTKIDLGTTVLLNDASFPTDNNGYIVGQTGFYALTTDGGKNWTTKSMGANLNNIIINSPKGMTDFIITSTEKDSANMRFYISANNGTTFTEIIDSLSGFGVAPGTLLTSFPESFSRGYLFRNDYNSDSTFGELGWMRSIDTCKSWDVISGALFKGVPFPDSIKALTFYSNKLGLVTGIAGQIAITNDSGRSWRTTADGITNTNKTDFYAAAFIDSNNIVIVGDNCTIIKSTDGGLNWYNTVSQGTTRLKAVKFIEGGLYGLAVGEKGTVLFSFDMGESWMPLPANVTDDLTAVAVPPNQFDFAFITGANGTLLKIERADAVNENNITEDIKFVISPNPAQDQISINLKNSFTNNVSVSINNSLGTTVIQKRFCNTTAGYALKINTSELSAGVYFCTVRSGNYTDTKKFVIIR